MHSPARRSARAFIFVAALLAVVLRPSLVDAKPATEPKTDPPAPKDEKADAKQAARAALQIATLHGEAKEKEKQIAALRYVVKRYAKSKEATEAEGRLGDLGVPPDLPDSTVFDFLNPE